MSTELTSRPSPATNDETCRGAMCHTRALPDLVPAVSVVLSRDMSSANTSDSSSSLWRSRPDATLHSRTSLPWSPVASSVMSPESITAWTHPAQSSVHSSLPPSEVSHSLALAIASPVARSEQSTERRTLSTCRGEGGGIPP